MNGLLVYLVSLLDGLSGTATFVACIGIMGAPLLWLWSGIEDEEERIAFLKSKVRPLFLAGVAGVVVATLVPRTEDLLRGFLVVEGSKLATAEKAEEAAKGFAERMDKLIDAIGGKQP